MREIGNLRENNKKKHLIKIKINIKISIMNKDKIKGQ